MNLKQNDPQEEGRAKRSNNVLKLQQNCNQEENHYILTNYTKKYPTSH